MKRLILPLSSSEEDIEMLHFSNMFASREHDFGFQHYSATGIAAFDELFPDAA